ncbi:MAG: transglutaminase domain-containing protein [Lachnospiraceae bacterium]|nr:transglutaminase domain-containing protein [Lachnospiraceae bacterium]
MKKRMLSLLLSFTLIFGTAGAGLAEESEMIVTASSEAVSGTAVEKASADGGSAAGDDLISDDLVSFGEMEAAQGNTAGTAQNSLEEAGLLEDELLEDPGAVTDQPPADAGAGELLTPDIQTEGTETGPASGTGLEPETGSASGTGLETEIDPASGTETDTESLTGPSEATESESGTETESETELESAAESGLLSEEMTELEDSLLESGSEDETQLLTVTESGTLEDASFVTMNAQLMSRPYGAALSGSTGIYSGRFGDQLTGLAKSMYDARVYYYVNQGKTGTMSLPVSGYYTVSDSPVQFTAAITTANGLDRTTKAYTDACNEIAFAMQSSLDAFLYDYPEIFWLRGGSFSYAMTATGSKSKGWKGYVASIAYVPSQAFSNASSLMASYKTAVQSVAAYVSSNADYDADGRTDDVELAWAAHDYLCQRLYYDYAAYADYMKTNDYRIFCSAGAFLDSVGTGVVCEGYAKAYKVLCNALGIPCVLIGGYVTNGNSLEGHMWNGIYLGDGWYLVDVTWDDEDYGIDYSYFLVAGNEGYRSTSGNFSAAASGTTTIFAYPVLEKTNLAYCSGAHDYQTKTVVAATCSTRGYTQYVCSRCGNTYRTNYKAINSGSHKFVNGQCTLCGAYDTIGHATVSAISAQGYTGKNITPSVTVRLGSRTLSKGIDYKIAYKNNKKRGTASAVITGIGNYRGNRTITFKIVKKSVPALTFSRLSAKTYNGKSQTPVLTVKNGSVTLKKNTDYTVSYSKNKEIGTAVVTIKGKGNYSGTKKLYFSIVPGKSAVTNVTSGKKKLTVSWKKGKGASGCQIQYSTSSSFAAGKTWIVTAASGTANKTTIKNLTSKNTYYVRVRSWKKVGKKQYYSSWSGKKKIGVK